MRATIKQDDEIICKDIEISLDKTINPASGRTRCDGDFFLPQGDYVEPGNYTLLLEDGRQGGIAIGPIAIDLSPGDLPTRVHFQVQGGWLDSTEPLN